MRAMALLTAALAAAPALAEIVVPVRTIRPHEVIEAVDIAMAEGRATGALTRLSQAVGKEARVALYAGRPVRAGDLGPPALVARNDTVMLIFSRNGLRITTEGRALDRAAAGETVRVMNLASRSTVTGLVRADGAIEVR